MYECALAINEQGPMANFRSFLPHKIFNGCSRPLTLPGRLESDPSLRASAKLFPMAERALDSHIRQCIADYDTFLNP